MLQLYDKLLKFPLFQGLGYNDLIQIVAHTKFDFKKSSPQQTMIRCGDKCDKIYFIVNGNLDVVTPSFDNDYQMHETISAPYTIQPERLFGMEQTFTSTFTSLTDTNFIIIDKKEVTRLCDNFTIFRINLINVLATLIQKANDRIWLSPPPRLETRIANFVFAHSLRPIGAKTLHIRMERLAQELNVSRLDISHTLNHLQDRGIVNLNRCRINIPSLEELIASTQR